MEERIVFVDIETGGLRPSRPIIQLAAVAVDANLRALESIELKVRFDESACNPFALKKNSFSREIWAAEGLPRKAAAFKFSAFLRRHATIDLSSSGGTPYRVAQLAAHNAEFDGPRIHAWFKRIGLFCPARRQVLCTLQRCLWHVAEHENETPPADFKLRTLCQYFGVPLRESEAHDALVDVRATLALYRALVTESRRAAA